MYELIEQMEMGFIILQMAVCSIIIMFLFLGIIIYVNIKTRYSIERFIMRRRYIYPILRRGTDIYNFSKEEARVLILVLQSYVGNISENKLETNFQMNENDVESAKEHNEKEEDKRSDFEKLKYIPECSICKGRQSEIVFIPCGHLITCFECYSGLRKFNQLEECPLCKRGITHTTKLFI